MKIFKNWPNLPQVQTQEGNKHDIIIWDAGMCVDDEDACTELY